MAPPAPAQLKPPGVPSVQAEAWRPSVPAAPAAPGRKEPPRRPTPAGPKGDKPSWEFIIGEKVLSRLGITALVVGVVFFFGYMLQYMGPGGKVATGLALAAVLVLVGIFLERKKRFGVFPQVIVAGGWALAYFAAYAMYHIEQAKIVHNAQLAGLILLCAAGAFFGHALISRWRETATLAFVLTFLAILISDLGGYTLLAGALLSATACAVYTRTRWHTLPFVALIGIWLVHLLWFHPEVIERRWPVTTENQALWGYLSLLANWVFFKVALLIVSRKPGQDERISRAIELLNLVVYGVLLIAGTVVREPARNMAFVFLLPPPCFEVGRIIRRARVDRSVVFFSFLVAFVGVAVAPVPLHKLWVNGALCLLAGIAVYLLPCGALWRLSIVAPYVVHLFWLAGDEASTAGIEKSNWMLAFAVSVTVVYWLVQKFLEWKLFASPTNDAEKEKNAGAVVNLRATPLETLVGSFWNHMAFAGLAAWQVSMRFDDFEHVALGIAAALMVLSGQLLLHRQKTKQRYLLDSVAAILVVAAAIYLPLHGKWIPFGWFPGVAARACLGAVETRIAFQASCSRADRAGLPVDSRI